MSEITYCEDCWTELPVKRKGRSTLYCSDCSKSRWKQPSDAHRNFLLLRDALDELAPFGLTDDAPARQSLRRAA